jgi:short subunit dehydrogenase-like uncharacterized protein
MPSRIVVFGATGYTGRLTAERLVQDGARPVLAGRSPDRLIELAASLGGLETRVADVAQPGSVAALVERGDVLLSTVGPFKRWGEPALRAAVGAGAVYIDSTGEPPFIRRVFDEFGPLAEHAGATLMTAMGYDFVPGTLAAALALEQAGRGAVRVDVGYYALGGKPQSLSSGTKASLAGVAGDRAFAYRAGRLTAVRSAERVRDFSVRGKPRAGISVGGVEHYTLPAAYPRLREVNVYLGWFAGMSRVVQVSSRLTGGIMRLPGISALAARGGEKLATLGGPGPAPGTTPGTRSHIAAIAYDHAGTELAEVHVAGADVYHFTARFLAWAARRAADDGVAATGAVGPLQAFGLDAFEAGCAEAGIARVNADQA